MKKIFTLLYSSLMIFSCAYAQIPNPSFESWTPYTSPYGNGEYPISWQTTDSTYLNLSFGATGHSAIRELTDTCNGSYSIKLISVSGLGLLGPGVVTNGKFSSATTIVGGSPFTARAAQLDGCYKYIPNGTDTARVSALLSKWNGVARDTIALAYSNVFSTSSLTNFQINFVYWDLVNSPDTILIIAASGQAVNRTVAGSYLIIDNVSTSGTVGIHENSFIKNITIFPQPAQDELNIKVELNQTVSMTYEVADITGKKIITGKMNSTSEKIDISALSRGNYFIALRNQDGAVLYTSKFMVTK